MKQLIFCCRLSCKNNLRYFSKISPSKTTMTVSRQFRDNMLNCPVCISPPLPLWIEIIYLPHQIMSSFMANDWIFPIIRPLHSPWIILLCSGRKKRKNKEEDSKRRKSFEADTSSGSQHIP